MQTAPETVSKLDVLLTELRQMKANYEGVVGDALSKIDYDKDPTQALNDEEAILTDQDYVRDLCLNQFGQIQNGLWRFEGATSRLSLTGNASESSTITPEIRLPTIKIPKFDGDPRKFLKFKALFQNIVHEDASILSVRKLYYLQEALTDKAEEFVRDIDITKNSYSTAWAELCQRFDNKRSIIRLHFLDLFSIPKISSKSQLRGLLDTVTVVLRELKVCGEAVDNWSSIISYFVSTWLNEKTRQDFENSVADSSVYPSWKTLKHFLDCRAANSITGDNDVVKQAKLRPQTSSTIPKPTSKNEKIISY